jgi:hypothetical protein
MGAAGEIVGHLRQCINAFNYRLSRNVALDRQLEEDFLPALWRSEEAVLQFNKPCGYRALLPRSLSLSKNIHLFFVHWFAIFCSGKFGVGVTSCKGPASFNFRYRHSIKLRSVEHSVADNRLQVVSCAQSPDVSIDSVGDVIAMNRLFKAIINATSNPAQYAISL